MNDITAKDLVGISIDMERPTPLYRSSGHQIYWLGITDETAFRCNAYLIRDGEEAILLDPGSRRFFDQLWTRVGQIMDPEKVSGMILCHQDPDVAASMVDWLEVNPDMRVYSTARTHVLLPHYGCSDYNACHVSENPILELPSGSCLRFIEAPFLHFSGAFVTYDDATRYLFSGDIWAALDIEWELTVKSFEDHVPNMDLFHVDYMASNLAARGFVRRVEGIAIDAILPQHGSLIGPDHVDAALDYLQNLRCGTDIVYADLES
ncbi:MAG: MBL fold metallo-hydrolase [Pseudomonadota bacterium]|nr:MBL fold metallo-hydrolase [Pseudomonadota bacterium]